MKRRQIFTLQVLIFFAFLLPANFFLYLNLKQKNIFPEGAIDLYEKYINSIHHMRGFEDYLGIKTNPSKLIYTKYGVEGEGGTVLMQGDSWFNFDINESAIARLNKIATEGKFQIISGGTASYSPSLMHKQFEILTRDYNIKPKTIIIHIDQTDVGDEDCRYRPKFFKTETEWGVRPENFDSKEVFEMKFFLAQQRILNSSSLALVKAFELVRLRFERYFLSSEYKNPPRCPFSKITEYLERPNEDARIWFKSRLKDYIEALVNFPGVEQVRISTHKHRRHFESDTFGQKYILDVSPYVAEVVHDIKAPRGVRIRYREITGGGAGADLFISDDPGSHLKPEHYPNFIAKLFSGA